MADFMVLFFIFFAPRPPPRSNERSVGARVLFINKLYIVGILRLSLFLFNKYEKIRYNSGDGWKDSYKHACLLCSCNITLRISNLIGQGLPCHGSRCRFESDLIRRLYQIMLVTVHFFFMLAIFFTLNQINNFFHLVYKKPTLSITKTKVLFG